uniref:uncharacterized protein LOC131128453 n=1 Tax=Doryrhamphus excisus TaxID=161450 RepID=UPI0025AE7880|nr:uncharacterized protein LOC131128453 [Doryrhamphus excisus]
MTSSVSQQLSKHTHTRGGCLCSIGAPSVFHQCSIGAPSVFHQCSIGAPSVFHQCSIGVPSAIIIHQRSSHTDVCYQPEPREMSLALIHDRQNIRSFWENRIHVHHQHAASEERRMNASALHKLRGEWLTCLEKRNKHLKSLKDGLVPNRKPEATPCP